MPDDSQAFSVVFFNQSLLSVFLDLAEETARRMGPVLLHTGTEIKHAPRGVTVWQAPRYDNSSLRSRARTWSLYVSDAARASTRVRVPRGARPPVAFLASNPPMLPALGYALSRTRGWPYVVQVLDIYPDVLTRRGMVTTSHPVARAWSMQNRLVYARASSVVTLGERMADVLDPYMPPGRRAEVIPTWASVDEVVPREKGDNWFAKEHGLVDELVVMYSGNLGLTHNLGALFDAARELEGDAAKPAVHVVMIGNAARMLENDPSLKDRPNVTFLPFQPAAVVPFSLSSGDVAVVTLGREAGGLSMPSKTYFAMAAGSALLGVGYGGDDIERLIEKHRCGLYVRGDDPRAVAAAVRRFRDEPAFLAECKRNARRAAESDFSARSCIAHYLELFEHAAGSVVP